MGHDYYFSPQIHPLQNIGVLKQFRVGAGMTQAKVATAIGVTQPTYQRWEAGTTPIPEAKLKTLAKIVKASPEALLGRHPPIEASLYDDSVSDDLSYYGEVAVHFCGGGEPLLLSVLPAMKLASRILTRPMSNSFAAWLRSQTSSTKSLLPTAVSKLRISKASAQRIRLRLTRS